MPLKIDLHTHTHYSEDATTTLKQVVQYAKKQGLDGVAVTDHNTIIGARRLVKQKKLIVITGAEIETQNGHVLALDIEEPIEHKLSLTETIERIHQFGGTAIIAHPATALKSALGQKFSSVSSLDAVEVINSSAFPFFASVYLSRLLAERLRLPETAGSDAHHPEEIGKAYTLVEADPDPDDIIDAIRKGRTEPFGRPISWSMRLGRGASGLRERLRGH